MERKEGKIISFWHRGGFDELPENGVSAFERAAKNEAQGVEFDVYVAQDGEVVVIHDETVNRTTNGSGKVEEMGWNKLQTLKLKNTAGQVTEDTVPALTQVLDCFEGTGTLINIELKGKHTAEPVYRIVQRYIAEKGWKRERFIISSFRHEELEKYRELDKEIAIAALIDDEDGNRKKLAVPTSEEMRERIDNLQNRFQPIAVNVCHEWMTAKLAEALHSRGYKVYVWTVNEGEQLEKLINQTKVDGFFSDKPALLQMKWLNGVLGSVSEKTQTI